MKRFIFFISLGIILTNALSFSQTSSTNLYSLKKSETLLSALIFNTNNYAFVVREIENYETVIENPSYKYRLYHNTNIVGSYDDIKYYQLNADNSISMIVKESSLNRDMWFIKNSSSAENISYDEIKYIDYNTPKNRALAFMYDDSVGYIVDINGSSIDVVGHYDTIIDSSISENGKSYAIAITRGTTNYFIENGVETPLGDAVVSDINISKDGSRVIYKKYIDGQYFLVDNDLDIGPYREINNIAISKNNEYLAYSFQNLPITNMIVDLVEIQTIVSNVVISTNYNSQPPFESTNINPSISTNNTQIETISTNSNNNQTQSIVVNQIVSDDVNENITVITNVVGNDTNIINYITDDNDEPNNNSSDNFDISAYEVSPISMTNYNLSLVNDGDLSEYAIVEDILYLQMPQQSNQGIMINDLYGFTLSNTTTQNIVDDDFTNSNSFNLDTTNFSVTTNTQVILTNILQPITKEIIIEQKDYTIALNDKPLSSYDNIKSIEFSPNSKSLLYVYEENGFSYIVNSGNVSGAYTNISTYGYSPNGNIFAYNADDEMVINSVIEQTGISVSDIYYLHDDFMLYKKDVLDSFVITGYDYESAIYDDILSFDVLLDNNGFVFIGSRNDKYYYVDKQKIEHGPYFYVSPSKNVSGEIYSILSDGKNISLIKY